MVSPNKILKDRPTIEQNYSPLLYLAIAASFAVSAFVGWNVDIRFDEAYTLDTTSRGVGYAFKQAINFEQQAPLYFVVLSVWRRANESIFFARLLSIVCVPLTVYAAAGIARRFLSGVDPVKFAVVVGIHYQIVWSAVEIRPYALMLLLSVWILATFYDGFIDERRRRGSQYLFVAACVAGLYTQYYLGFLMAGCGIVVLLFHRRSLAQFTIATAAITALFVPMIVILTSQVADVRGQTQSLFGGLPLIKAIYQMCAVFLFPMDWVAAEQLRAWVIRALIVSVIIGLFAAFTRSKHRRDLMAIVTITVVPIIMFTATNYYLGDQGIQHRHFSVVLIPVLLVLFSIATDRPRVATLICILLIALNAAQVFSVYQAWNKPGDNRRVAEYITASESPGQPVLVFHADAILAIRHYYRGVNPLIALPQENGFEHWDPRQNVIRDEKQLRDRIESVSPSATEFWLVTDGWCAQGSLSFNCEALESFVEREIDVIAEQQFSPPTTVRMIRRKP